MVNARKPHFLEVFLPALCSERLKIPTRFIKHLAGTASGSILLTGPSDNSWHVDLIEHNGHLFFDDGWPTFVKDHSIQCGDSLVFRYDGNSHFTVQIFDQSSCEKEEAFQAKCSQEPSDLNGCLRRKRERGREASISNVSVEKRFREGLMPVHLTFLDGDRNQKPGTFSNGNQEVKEVLMNRCDNTTLASIQASERPIVLGLAALNGQEMLTIIKSHTTTIASKIKNACSKKKRKKKSKKKKTETQKKSSMSEFIEARAAHYFTSSFPYFVRVMKYSNITKGTLKIPVKFSKEHLPNHKAKVILRNLDGDCWVLNSVPTVRLNSTMHSFCGGWSAFVRCNGIKMEDVCIFELVDKFEMRVHILRLGLEGLGSQTKKGHNDGEGVGADGLPPKINENVAEDDEVLPLQISEPTDDLNINGDVECKDSEMIFGTREAEYSIHNSALRSPVNSAPFLLSEVPNKSTDHLLECNADGTILYQMGINSGVELYTTPSKNVRLIAGDEKAVHSFTSPFPTFMKVMMSSNVSGTRTLAIPRKFSAEHLPTPRTEIVLQNMRGDCWNVTCTRYGLQTMFCRSGWASFVERNCLKVGDICIFELIDDKVFRVHVFEAGQRGQECLLSNDILDDDSTTTMDTMQYNILR